MIAPAQLDRLTRAITKLLSHTETFSGHCFRCVKPQYSSRLDAFSGEGCRKASGRFHVKGKFLLVYTSTDFQGAQWEYFHTARSSGIDVAYLLPLMAIGATVHLSEVLNLGRPDVLHLLGVTLTEIRDLPWSNSSGETLTQVLGRLAYEAGFEALLVPSGGGGQNLNIFRQNLLPGSVIEIINKDDLP